ncbi:hypothetical protein JJB11_20760 [Ramlibacter ginsenosidimutans]|uniref:Flagella basal body P-ring formation protein FlgA n=1 Tax=Ramlibacter ginsenosidimutans TaxID=502333 RepID=A0A934WN58_9BURK|nr:hypothetical protein [Ramlibacter ginsenosidimutans]MBK6008539.1 hypothetical protein [Ramlibacter ginsenosidimutans]
MNAKLLVLCGLMLAGSQAMACYTVYDGNNRVIYRGLNAPVDMSLSLHEALAARFPAGASLVFDQAPTCTPVSIAQVARPSGPMVPVNTIRMERTGRQISPTSEAPLFTDRKTAESQNLPHTTVAGDIVMVPPGAAARVQMSSYTLIPAQATVARAAGVNTAAMGAGPTPPANQTVITEMRNPPVTIIQRGGDVSLQR